VSAAIQNFFCRKIFILRLFISKIYLAINSMVKRNLSAPFYRPIQLFYRMMWAKKCPKIIPDKSITFGDMVRARRFGYGWWSWESSHWSNIKCPAVNRLILSFSHARHDCVRINVHLSLSLLCSLYLRVRQRIHVYTKCDAIATIKAYAYP